MTDFVTSREFDEHAKNEETNQRVTNDALHEGNLRMGRIEGNIAELAEDLKPLKAIYNAVIGAGGIGLMAIGLLLYIYTGDMGRVTEDRQALKALSESVLRQGVAIEKLILKHEELERDTVKDLDRIHKQLEKAGKM